MPVEEGAGFVHLHGERAHAIPPVQTGPDKIVFELKDVDVSYGAQLALERVSLRIHRGEYVGILGPNGSGKTSLLRTLLGLQAPTRGSVALYGRSPSERHSSVIGYVSQHASMPPKAVSPFTVDDVVASGRVARRGLGARLDRRDWDLCRQAMERVGLAASARARISALSGGQRQRAFLARALASEPDVLVLDEPTTGLDREARAEFSKILDDLNHTAGLTIVLVSHDTEAVLASAHRLIELNRRIMYDGPPVPHGAHPHGQGTESIAHD